MVDVGVCWENSIICPPTCSESRLYFSSIFYLLWKNVVVLHISKVWSFSSLIIKNPVCDLLTFLHQSWFCKNGFVPEFCLCEFFPLSRYTRKDSLHIILRNTLSLQMAVNLKWQDLPRSHVHFLALGPRELKFLKLLEQNQACLPKLITPGR